MKVQSSYNNTENPTFYTLAVNNITAVDAGVYYFNNAATFFKSAFTTIKNDVQLDGKYYISPVINDLVLNNKTIIPFQIDNSEYHLFYSPQVLQDYERN
jgi:bifunctional N-acetylglucosamine-1-phosphate-uridyltransferase/glucosamine-1-phosphate-acetyltransferase GlmU-like protein